MDYTRLTGESADYLRAREELRLAEIELMQQRERVAEMRRALPLGPVVDDYAFLEGPRSLDDGDAPVATVRLSELFTAADRPLVVYHLMYGKAQTEPCPMCTQWIDGFNGIAQPRRAERRPRGGRRGRSGRRCEPTPATAAGTGCAC